MNDRIRTVQPSSYRLPPRRPMPTSPTTPGKLKPLSVALLGCLAFTNCECDEVQDFVAGARYAPEIMDFGEVPVLSEKVEMIDVLSSGTKGLKVGAALVDAPLDAKFIVAHWAEGELRPGIPQILSDGLAPARSATVAVVYRPCPDAWDDGGTPDVLSDDRVKAEATYSDCATARDQAKLRIADNTTDGASELILSAQPVYPPSMEIACPRGSGHCNTPDGTLDDRCVSLSFGNVSAGQDEPCDLVVELQNHQREGAPTGALEVERVDLLVFDINDRLRQHVDGRDVGFSILNVDGTPLTLDSAEPLSVPIPEGSTSGHRRFLVRFDGSANGTWRGDAMGDGGLRLYTNDPDKKPVLAIPLTAVGSAPNIQIFPQNLAFGPVDQGASRALPLAIGNSGDATLEVTSITVEGEGPFTFTTDRGSPPYQLPAFADGVMELTVTYAPTQAGQHSGRLVIKSNDANDPVVEVPLTGGAVPKLRVDPPDTLVFALPDPLPPPPIPARMETMTLTNEGFGDLTINALNLVGPGSDSAHPSVDDFSIVGCPSLPCSPAVTLCPPAVEGCQTPSHAFTIVYDNNDNSTTDLAELHIETNDPTNPDHILVLSAQDVPCLFPTPVITVVSESTGLGEEIRVDATASAPGGPVGQASELTAYEWSWLFSPGDSPVFSNPEGASTTFTASRPGLYVLGLHVTNACGSRSQQPAQENITIRP